MPGYDSCQDRTREALPPSFHPWAAERPQVRQRQASTLDEPSGCHSHDGLDTYRARRPAQVTGVVTLSPLYRRPFRCG
jgi:hypothetical protein